jgi:gamma-glutamylcyclotransferase (GGCT)/AIG2-like uncharacterized protein YtfP
MIRHLFVYGTLRKEARNSMFHLMTSQALLIGPARVRGNLYDLGEYPGLVLVSDRTRTSWVYGDLYELKDVARMLAVLDDYEGWGPDHPCPGEFERILCTVLTEAGRQSKAWAYAYRGSTSDKRLIVSGDYLGISTSRSKVAEGGS